MNAKAAKSCVKVSYRGPPRSSNGSFWLRVTREGPAHSLVGWTRGFVCAMSRPMRFLCVIGCWKIIEHNHIGWWDRIEIRIKACTNNRDCTNRKKWKMKCSSYGKGKWILCNNLNNFSLNKIVQNPWSYWHFRLKCKRIQMREISSLTQIDSSICWRFRLLNEQIEKILRRKWD